MKFTQPEKLKEGDTIAVVSTSWGGPSVFPHVYESGLLALQKLGLKIKELPSARANEDFLYNNPEFRAKDINDAFLDKDVKAIFVSIGGDDTIRILPYLDTEIIQKNPKIIIGYSDTTTLLTYLNQLGLITLHGPSIMAGFSQWDSLGQQLQEHVKTILFENPSNYNYTTFDSYCEGYLDWSDIDKVGKTKELVKNDGWHWLQGASNVSGELYGGCVEVLEFTKSTRFWPKIDFWNSKMFFLETSEGKPSTDQVKYMLRNYGMQGVFDRISALMVGRARDYTEQEKTELDKVIVQVVKGEFRNDNLCIVSNMDFGHTDPQWILPLGVRAELDPAKQIFRLLESPFK